MGHPDRVEDFRDGLPRVCQPADCLFESRFPPRYARGELRYLFETADLAYRPSIAESHPRTSPSCRMASCAIACKAFSILHPFPGANVRLSH